MSNYFTSFALLVVGVGVFSHYFLMANALTKAAHWVKAAIPLAAASGAGMAACGLFGATDVGMRFSLGALACVTAVQIETWRCGLFVSEALRKAAEVKEYQAARTRQILYGIREPLRDLQDILTPRGVDEVCKQKEREDQS